MSKTIEEQVADFKHMWDGANVAKDGGGLATKYVQPLAEWVTQALQERDRIAREEERGRIKNIMLPWINDNQFLDDPTSEAFENAILQALTTPLKNPN